MGEKEKTQEIQTNEKESNTGVNRTVADCSDSGRRCGRFLFQRYSGSKEEADLNAYFGLNGSQEVAIIWNQELTEEKGLLQDERCYLKLDTVHEMLNERFYVDHNEKLLLYTLPEETVQIGIGEQTADGYTAAVEQNGDVWLALDYVKQYSDFNYALYTEPNRVVLTTNWDTLQSAELKKNTALRVRGGVKSEVLQNLEKGRRSLFWRRWKTGIRCRRRMAISAMSRKST